MNDFDLKLLNALQEDGRLTNLELAVRIGLSASQCSRRRTALEESGMIEGYRATVANQAVGLDVLVFIQVSLATQSPDSGQAFAKLIHGLEDVQEAYSLTGEADYLVQLVVPDLKTLARILNDVFLPHRSAGARALFRRARSREADDAIAAPPFIGGSWNERRPAANVHNA
jgi:DNA-binding Lrp family transcriptional regulator